MKNVSKKKEDSVDVDDVFKQEGGVKMTTSRFEAAATGRQCRDTV